MKINPMSTISYQATINADKKEIRRTLSNDKKMGLPQLANIDRIIDEVHTYSDMPQNSVVTIEPREHNNHSCSLICNVYDETGRVWWPIWERDARKLAVDRDFARRYKSNIRKAIVGVDEQGKSSSEIYDAFCDCKTIKGVSNQNGYLTDKPKEDIAKYFITKTSSAMGGIFKENLNPTRNIINTLKGIDESNPGTDKYIFIGRNGNGRDRFEVIYVDDDKIVKERSVLLREFLREGTVSCLERLV